MSRITDDQLVELIKRRNLPEGDLRSVSREALQFVLEHPSTAARLCSVGLSEEQVTALIEGRLVLRAEPAAASAVPLLSYPGKSELLIRGLDPRTFWNHALKADGWEAMAFPEFPTLAPATARACVEFGLIPIFCPAGELETVVGSDRGDKYILPDWGRNLDISKIERRSLPGQWILVETVPKPDWGNPAGYGTDDKVACLLGLPRCFPTNWDILHDGRLNKLAEVWGLPPNTVRLPMAEEMNWVGNLFLLANRVMGTNLPNLGATKGWEWCENFFGSDYRLLFGSSKCGGLAAVGKDWYGRGFSNFGFRVMAVLA